MAFVSAIDVRCSRCCRNWVRFTPDGYIPPAPLCGSCQEKVEKQEADAQESSPVVVSRATTLRIPLPLRERVAKLAEKLSRASGMTVRRFDVLRRALEVGLATLEEGGEDTYIIKGRAVPQTPTSSPVTSPSGVANTPTSPKETP